MSESSVANAVLWGVQIFLALFFLGAGAPKILGRGIERWTGFTELARPMVIFTGIAEVLGAIGLVLPTATGVLPWLTPIAAIGLGLIVLMASGFHTRARERLEALETALWASIAAMIAIGRWDLVASRIDVRPAVIVLALAVLVPAVIVNLVILLRRPPRNPANVTPRRAPTLDLRAPHALPDRTSR